MENIKDLRPITSDNSSSKRPIIIAGPCSAETEDQVLDTAHSLARCGVKLFRAGLWKPRTMPGNFEGVGYVGLSWLVRVSRETGMRVVTEVATSEHVNAVVEAGIDMMWIGARTVANPFAMQEIADALQGNEHVSVLVKNPVNPDLELWLGGLQRIYNAGIRRLGAIHRGFSAYGKHLYRNAPQWRIAIELHRRVPELPMLCDPSHMGGKREHVALIAQQALDMGFDGLMVESHCNPEKALSDKEQQITPTQLKQLLSTLIVRNTASSTESLALLRQRIDQCDNELMEILAQRMSIAREIGLLKKAHNMPIVQLQRYDEILKRRLEQATQLGLGPDFMKQVLQAIHEESVNQQIN